MGYGAVFDLVKNSNDVEAVTVADMDLAKAKAVADAVDPAKVTPREIDASDVAATTANLPTARRGGRCCGASAVRCWSCTAATTTSSRCSAARRSRS